MKLLWTDLETTGLNLHNIDILEIAWILTDEELNEIDTGDRILYYPNESIYLNMISDYAREMHTKSGLLQKCFESKIQRQDVQIELIDLIKNKCDGDDVLLAGSTVGFDRSVIRHLWYDLDKVLHHRVIDVSAIKNCAKMWYPEHVIEHKRSHRAMDDIRQSIEEFKYYKENIFK